jgi:hypothetical protein
MRHNLSTAFATAMRSDSRIGLWNTRYEAAGGERHFLERNSPQKK